MKTVTLVAVSAVLLYAVMPVSAQAQKASCPGGEAKTAAGECVNPGLSSSLRIRSILMSQPKISQTAFPIPPSQDRVYPQPREYNRYELTQGIFSTNPSPFSCHPNCVVIPRTTTFTTAR
jgi:hypothetical protein